MAVDILQGLLTQHPQPFFPIGTKASPIVPEVPEYQMPAPQSGTDMVNGSVAEEAVAEASRAAEQEAQQAQQAQQRQATQNAIQRGLLEPAAREDTARQDPAILNRFQRNLVQGLVDSKALYDAAKNDAVRQQIAAGANSVRDIAGRLGVDVSGYGADVPYSDAAQRLALNDARALYDVLYNSKTSDDYYMDAYNKIMDAGGYEGTAREVAGDAARKYQAEQTKKLRDAFLTYGMDGRGVVNQNGEVLLGMMANENPALAEILAKTNPMPVQNWNFENGLITANEGFKRDLQKMGEQFAQRDKERREGFQHDFQKAAYLSDLETKKALTIKQGYAQIDQMVKNMDRDRANAEAYRQCLVLAGGDEAMAQQLFAQYSLKAGMWGRGSAGGSSSGDGGSETKLKLNAKQQEFINSYQMLVDEAKRAVQDGSVSREADGNAVDAAVQKILSIQDEGLFDPDTYSVLYRYAEELNKARDEKWKGKY
jgi:hypothetical protein